MEPPGTAGAPGAAGRPWDEAKAFYDNLAPKKKPKSVRTPRCGTGQRCPPRGRGGPAALSARGCCPLGASPRMLHLLRVALGLSSCPISGFSGVLPGASSWLGSPTEPCGSRWVSHFFWVLWGPSGCLRFFVDPLNLCSGPRGSPGSLRVPLLLHGIPWLPRVSPGPSVSQGSCSCWRVPGSFQGCGVLAGWLSVPGAGSRGTAQGPNPCPGQGGVTGVYTLLPGSPAPGD